MGQKFITFLREPGRLQKVADWLTAPVGGSDRRTEVQAARVAAGRATTVVGPGDALVGGLKAIGAAVAAALGVGGSVLLIGSAVLWERFHHAGLPATQALQRVPESQIRIEGIETLAAPVILALVAVLFVFASDSGGVVTRGSLIATILLAAGGCIWAVMEHASRDLSFWATVALSGMAVLLLFASLGVAASSGNRFLPFAAAIFISTVVFTGALNVASEAHRGNIQSAAVLKSPGGLGLFGFYIADTDDAIYLGIIRDGHEPVRGDPVAMYTIPREDDTRLLIGPEASWEQALADACELRSQLEPDRPTNPACGSLKASVAKYLAIGDSYSSGEGAPPYDLGRTCHRSSSGWPSIVAANADNLVVGDAVNLACSGATIRDLDASFKGESSQLDRITPKNRFLTVTIGGNDAGFSRVLIQCRNPVGSDCTNGSAVTNAQKHIARVLPSALESLYQELSESVGDKGHVVAVGYPRLLPIDSDECGWLSEQERTALNDLQADLENVIAEAAEAAEVHHVDVSEVLDGHELCSDSPWINELTLNPDLEDTGRGHPTKPGQEAIAGPVAEAIEGLRE